jgi:hypothetical protein
MPELGGGRHVLQLLETLRRRNGDAVKRSGLNLRQRIGHLIPQQIDLPRQEIADGGGLIRDKPRPSA